MKLAVEFYTDDRYLGKIILTPDSKFVLDPPDSKFLRRVLREPVWLAGKAKLDTVFSHKEPIKFMHGLSSHYKSQGLRATKPNDSEDDDSSNSGKLFADTPPRPPPRRSTDPPTPLPSVPSPPPPPTPPPTHLEPPPRPQNPPVPHQAGGPQTQRRYGLRPGPGWRSGGQSRRGTPVWTWGPHTREPAEEEEEAAPPPPAPEPVQRGGGGPASLPSSVLQPISPPLPSSILQPILPLPQRGVPNAGIGGTGQPIAPQPVATRGPVAGAPQRPSPNTANQVGQGTNRPTGAQAPGTASGDQWRTLEKQLNHEAAAKLERVNRHLNNYADVLYGWGHWRAVHWISELQEHINEVGVDEALESLGEERNRSVQPVAYETTGHLGGDEDSNLIRHYLDRVGITLVNDKVSPPENLKVVRSAPPREGSEGKYQKWDVVPTWTNFDDKLQEAKNLPGLESTEDLDVIHGAPVTHFTPEVTAKLDERYGKDEWIVKTYGDEAYAGFGIFMPPYVKKIQQNAKIVLYNANKKLMDKGFTLARDKSTNRVLGIMSTDGKARYRFDSKELNALPDTDIKRWANAASKASLNEHGTALPLSSEDALYHKLGLKIKWSDQVKEDGTKNALGIRYLDGREVDFGTPEWEAIQDDDSNDYMIGEIDRAATSGGIRGNVRYMAQPAFASLGVSEEDRAKGYTWETGQEGRVHIVTRDGKATVLPYASMARRNDTTPIVFADDESRAMEQAALEAINAGPESERSGQVYAPDVMKTEEGWRVVERNASVPTGSSAWLESNPLVIDAYVSHLAGRDPAHVQFIRGLLAGRPRARPAGLPAASSKER